MLLHLSSGLPKESLEFSEKAAHILPLTLEADLTNRHSERTVIRLTCLVPSTNKTNLFYLKPLKWKNVTP